MVKGLNSAATDSTKTYNVLNLKIGDKMPNTNVQTNTTGTRLCDIPGAQMFFNADSSKYVQYGDMNNDSIIDMVNHAKIMRVKTKDGALDPQFPKPFIQAATTSDRNFNRKPDLIERYFLAPPTPGMMLMGVPQTFTFEDVKE